MRVEVMSKNVDARENGAKVRVVRKYCHTYPRAKLRSKHLWVGGSCWEKKIKLKLATKTWACKKNSSYKFSQSLTIKCLSRIHISLCLVIPPQRGKTKHHCGSRRSKCQAATLYGPCTSLSNGKRNAICT